MSRTTVVVSPFPLVGVGVALSLGLLAFLFAPADDAMAGSKVSKAWKKAAKDLRSAVKLRLKADYLSARGRALVHDTEQEIEDALEDALEDYTDGKGLDKEQYDARLELAERLGEDDIYRVEIDPSDFVPAITNTYMPFTPGRTWTYRGETDEGTEVVVVTVLEEKKSILGVSCTVVRDTVRLDGVLVEDTWDWFAQDTSGNVWYFGELSFNYEDGELHDMDGSWVSGVDGAQPGIVMSAAPVAGEIHRQEFLLGEAEDYAEVVDTDASATVIFGGTYNGCLQTLDATPLEPDALEHKYYAPGIGFILETNLESGERLELVDYTSGD